MRRRKVLPHAGWFTLSVLIMVTVLVPTAYLLWPHLLQGKMIRQLNDDDPAARAQALRYVVRYAPTDPRVFRGAVRRLSVNNEQNFLQIVGALDNSGLWARPAIPPEPWLRWLRVLCEERNAEARILAAQLMADLPDLAADQQLNNLVGGLIGDAVPDVRYNALAAAAELAGVGAARRGAYEALIRGLAKDPEPKIVRHAWIILGLLGSIRRDEALWRDVTPEVASAILWAALKVHPDHPAAAIEALHDETVNLSIRATAAYALHQSRHRDAVRALETFADLCRVRSTADPRRILTWRALLAAPATVAFDDPFATLLGPTESGRGNEANQSDGALLAALYRVAGGTAPPRNVLSRLAPHPLPGLAILEGMPVGQWPLVIPDHVAPMLRIAAVAVMKDPKTADLRPLLASDQPPLRDLACVVAAQRFTQEQNSALVGSLLSDFNDDAKRSGAILAGLTGLRSNLLQRRLAAEDIWAVAQIHQLGLWMQGHRPQFDQLVDGLLVREDLPTTTILLAMLHKGPPTLTRALDFLLNPRGAPRLDLVQLFDQHRWWFVLKQYLRSVGPDPPPFWVWADPDLEAFQVEVLRDWYLVNRGRLTGPAERQGPAPP